MEKIMNKGECGLVISNQVSKVENHLISTCTSVDLYWHWRATLIVDVQTYKIVEASIMFYKSPRTEGVGIKFFNHLVGRSGYFDGKRYLNTLLTLPFGDIAKYAFNHCINGLVQAESYIFTARGFKSKDEYDAYWNFIEAEGCRMYTHPSTEDLPWTTYISKLDRDEYLFSRFLYVESISKDKPLIYIGILNDSHHEISVSIELKPQCFEIARCKIAFLRAPGRACFENELLATTLEGLDFMKVSKKTLIKMVGGKDGCYHLLDLILAIQKTIRIERSEYNV